MKNDVVKLDGLQTQHFAASRRDLGSDTAKTAINARLAANAFKRAHRL